MRRETLAVAMAIVAAVAISTAARAQSCTAGDFSAAVERSAETLRTASREFHPKLHERLRRYQKLKGLSDADYEAAALSAIEDKKIEDLDAKSSELLLKIDGLGRIPDGKDPNCAELDDIAKNSKELLATVKEKSQYMLARLDSALAEIEPKPAPAKEAGKEKEQPREPAREITPPAERAPAPPGSIPANKPAESWAATTKPNDAFTPENVPKGAADAAAPGAAASGPGADGYTIEEIQDATRGFFGSISTGLAGVIEHAFKTSGRPAAYVLGTEGGGAFLAGLRFGEGKLFMRNQSETRKVWWHGPSIGGDIGASGTRTMFLIYHLSNQDALFRNYTGVDGSAFFVGGVGMTVLKGGDVIMAPIRTGLGFRVGASIGYVKFTPSPTWNPF